MLSPEADSFGKVVALGALDAPGDRDGGRLVAVEAIAKFEVAYDAGKDWVDGDDLHALLGGPGVDHGLEGGKLELG